MARGAYRDKISQSIWIRTHDILALQQYLEAEQLQIMKEEAVIMSPNVMLLSYKTPMSST